MNILDRYDPTQVSRIVAATKAGVRQVDISAAEGPSQATISRIIAAVREVDEVNAEVGASPIDMDRELDPMVYRDLQSLIALERRVRANLSPYIEALWNADGGTVRRSAREYAEDEFEAARHEAFDCPQCGHRLSHHSVENDGY